MAKEYTDDLDRAMQPATCAVWAAGELAEGLDPVATECPVALVYNGISHVVMMATPTELEDFALGFSLSEGIVQTPQQLLDIEQRSVEDGIEIAITISSEAFAQLKHTRRNLSGRTGCGLCGAESLQQAIPALDPVISDLEISHHSLQLAVSRLDKHQPVQKQTGAVHAAAWCDEGGQLLLVREDVGRHNALDKLLGAISKQKLDVQAGFVLVTSRASYEMVVKTVRANIAVLAAVSAPTTLAIRLARQSGIGLVGFSRLKRHVIYAGQYRFREEV